jgi:hypothetical protein
MAQVVIPANRQKPGELVGGFWVVLQAWPIANLHTVALLGPEGMRITEGYGQWDVIETPRDVGITEWKGRRNYKATLDVLYDGWLVHPIRPNLPQSFIGRPPLPKAGTISYASGSGAWIEGMITSLENLATVQPKMMTPPSLRIYGAVPHPELQWVIENLDWGDSISDKVTGRRMRQQVTVHLLEYHQPTELQKLPRGKADPKK